MKSHHYGLEAINAIWRHAGYGLDWQICRIYAQFHLSNCGHVRSVVFPLTRYERRCATHFQSHTLKTWNI